MPPRSTSSKQDVRARIARRYERFSRYGAADRSPVYAGITAALARDQFVLDRLTEMPGPKRQPNLLLGAVRFLYGTPEDPNQFAELVRAHWDEISALMAVRTTQTNEPARCATLLPALARLPQPLALLEVGASGGLCLLPDRYAYDFGDVFIGPSEPPPTDPPTFSCRVLPGTPLPQGNIEVAWRAGLDRRPVDLENEEDVRWLEALVWPGEEYRIPLLRAAIEIARAERPRVVRGDLRTEDLSALAAQAPSDATLVVYHTAVLAYVRDPEQRLAFARSAKELGATWIANEGAERIPGIGERVFGGPVRHDAFLLCVDGKPVAWTDSHGTWLEWHGEAR
jgi:hypothetical protein